MRHADDWTIERWRTEPAEPLLSLELTEAPLDKAPPLWRDLALASALAVLFWGAAAVAFG
jgi:hypothetical protein